MYIMLVGCYVLLELAEKLALKAGFEQLPAPHYVYLTCPPRSLVPGQAGPTNSVTGCGGGVGEEGTARQPESKLTDAENR